MRQTILCFALLLALAGCQSEAPPASTSAGTEAAPAAAAPPNVLQPQMDALQKAKNVENQLLEESQQRDKDLDAMTGG
jgi:Skp family chaperone for outer membrane proteins